MTSRERSRPERTRATKRMDLPERPDGQGRPPGQVLSAGPSIGPTDMGIRILVVEDEAAIADFLVRGLREEGFTVAHAGDGDVAWHALREAWDDYTMQDAIALQLVKSPDIEDRQRLIEALASIDVNVIEKTVEAIKSLEIKPTDDEVLAAVRALRQSCFAPPNRVARQARSAELVR